MDVKKTDLIIFKRTLAKAASLTAEQGFDDTLCMNPFQNIFVVAKPFEVNARTYARVQQINMGKIAIGVAAYVAASDGTCKGVIRGTNLDLSDAVLTEMTVNRRNPGKWTSAMRGVDWATARTFAQRAKTRTNAADLACRHHHRIINAFPSVPFVEERTKRRTASAESASRCRTSCAKDGGAARTHDIHSWRPDQAAPTQLGAKRQMRENNHSSPLTQQIGIKRTLLLPFQRTPRQRIALSLQTARQWQHTLPFYRTIGFQGASPGAHVLGGQGQDEHPKRQTGEHEEKVFGEGKPEEADDGEKLINGEVDVNEYSEEAGGEAEISTTEEAGNVNREARAIVHDADNRDVDVDSEYEAAAAKAGATTRTPEYVACVDAETQAAKSVAAAVVVQAIEDVPRSGKADRKKSRGAYGDRGRWKEGQSSRRKIKAGSSEVDIVDKRNITGQADVNSKVLIDWGRNQG
ncbi:hypothetical protein MTO96_029156 [Rhipicephalus appendiculatus]